MTLTYDADHPPVYKDDPWSCSVCTTTWALQSLGIGVTEPQMEAAMLAAGLVTPQYGLMDASGAQLEAWLETEWGAPVERAWPATWDWVAAHAGLGPILLGGRAWGHWSAVRRSDGAGFDLANPAENWMGVGNYMDPNEWARLGPFSALFIPGEEAPVTDESRAYVQQVAADEIKANIEKALTLKLPKAAREALEFGALPASTTLAEGRF